MGQWFIANEAQLRLFSFLFVFAVLAGWEFLFPRRPRLLSRLWRWSNNLALVAINTIFLRLFFPFLAIEAAIYASERGQGILAMVSWPWWIRLIFAIVVLDLVIYLQHVVFHHIPLLWRFHRMHHIDLDLDVTSGTRFHPIEMGLSMIVKLTTIWWLGPDPEAVILFELILNAMAMFNHGNIRLPLILDRWLRWLVVTPDMHRVHHSQLADETNSNYGFNLSIWDRLFGTYRAQPRAGHQDMVIGLQYFRERKYSNLYYLLLVPFLSPSEKSADEKGLR
jgi:sterol desaturase/sphingolipid hydroxylase (fatty acid hydroxylase superfamily)